MTLKDAEKIVLQYASVLARRDPKGGLADCESWLAHPRDKIIQAMKLWLAHDIQHGSFTEDFYNEIATAAACLPGFFDDEQAHRMNAVLEGPGGEPKAKVQELLLQASVSGLSIRAELRDFVSAVQQLDVSDPLFYNRVCAIAGIEYAPSADGSFGQWF